MSEPLATNNDPRDSSHEAAATSHEPRTTNHVENADEISLLDLLIVLAKHKWLILGLPFVTALLAAIYALTLPNIYTATTKIFTPRQSQSVASAMFAQLGNLGGLAGLAGLRNPNDLYVAMLKSRTVADNLIQRFDLMKISGAKHPSQLRQVLEGAMKITGGRDGIIAIEVDDKDPKFAAELANACVDELFKLTQVLAVTEASQRRLFFERQFAQAKENLAKAEVTARQALEQGGLVKVDDQGRAMIENTARLRAQITVKEVQIGAMRTFAADRNPDLRLALQELESMKRQLAKIEGTVSGKGAESAPGGKGMDNLNLLRDLKYYEVIYEQLAKQYELAKIDESKESPIIQVLDKAVEPDVKSKPKRTQIVLFSAFVALVAGILWALFREAMTKASGNPQHAARWQALKRYLAWR